jgi:ABC-type lipoprotein release transport system permease subunit
MHFPDQDFKTSGVPGLLPAVVRSEITGIEESTVFWTAQRTNVSIPANNETKTFRKQEKIIYADDQYFNFFKYNWLAGSPVSALTGPNKVVLTESRAKTYFPYSDTRQAVGQTIIYDDTVKAIVTGIVKDLDEITDFTFKEFISLPTFAETLKKEHGWDKWGSVTSASQFFIKLRKNADTALINKELMVVRKKHEKNAYLAANHFLQPLNDIHFNLDFDAFDRPQGHKTTLYGLLAVAVFLLLLGCINFINLTTAQAAQRAKEIGIRKTMGSSRRNLVSQFLIETILLTSLATIVSIALTPWLLKIFTDFIPEGLHFDLIRQPGLFLFIITLILMVSILSGFYPAMILSGYKPVLVLKNLAYANTAQSRRAWIRKTLTVFQFVIAQFFIISTIVVGKQIHYSLKKDMGFKKDAIININAPLHFQHPDNKQFVLQEKLKTIPGIEKISLAGEPPASSNTMIGTIKFNKDGKEIETTVQEKLADTNYLSLYHLKLLAGRNLYQTDTASEYLSNESYARFLGFQNPVDIVGKYVNVGREKGLVVGLISDFQSGSTQELIRPLVLYCASKYHSTFGIMLGSKGENTNAWKTTIAKIEKAWKEVYPEEEFKYDFLDDSIAKFYKEEQRTSKLLNWCTGLAIFISCLGLLGLVIYTTMQRTKEIGVRKVLGASVLQIVSLLSKDFMQLVLLAFIITTPVAWWAMHKWLQNYAYRTTINWWIFGLCGMAMILIALLTLSFQTIKSAITNPVKSLRTE